MANVLLFGPPGIGKSTLISQAIQVLGEAFAVDLEDPRSRDLYDLMGFDWMFNQGRNGGLTIIGGAGLNPRMQYPRTVKVVLTLDESEYQRRRQMRDRKQPNKAIQPAQTVRGWSGIADAVYLPADEKALGAILALRRKDI